MAGQQNHLELEARLAREGELRFTPKGHAICKAAVGYTPRHRNKDTGIFEDGETSWFNIQAWGQTGEMLAEVPKGTLIQIIGHIEMDYWKGPEGERKEKLTITVDRFAIPVISSKSFHIDDDGNITFRRYQGKRVKDDLGADESPF